MNIFSLELNQFYKITPPVYDDYNEGLKPEVFLIKVISKKWYNSSYLFEYVGNFEEGKLIEYSEPFTSNINFEELKEYSIENYIK